MVWDHDIELLGAHGIGRLHGAGAVDLDAFDGPFAHGVELVAGEVGDFVVSERGIEAAFGGGEDVGIADGVVRVGHFLDNLRQDLLLVLAAVAVAGGVRFTFARES